MVFRDKTKQLVAFFDSGVGGLTAVAEFAKLTSGVDVVYFADTFNMPYGNKSAKDIERLAISGLSFLSSFNPDLIVVACGTVSSVLNYNKKDLSQIINAPIIFVIEPSCTAVYDFSKNKRIGVMATSATVNTASYTKALLKINPAIKVFEEPCPELALLIENNLLNYDACASSRVDSCFSNNKKIPPTSAECNKSALKTKMNMKALECDKDTVKFSFTNKSLKRFYNNGSLDFFDRPKDVQLIKKYLNFFCDKGIDVLILGCTHYPVIQDYVANFFEGKVKVVNSSREVAKSATRALAAMNLVKASHDRGNLTIYVSGDGDSFYKKAKSILYTDNFKDIKIAHAIC